MHVKLYEDDEVKVQAVGLIEVVVSTPDRKQTSIAVPPSSKQVVEEALKAAKDLGAKEVALTKIRDALIERGFK